MSLNLDHDLDTVSDIGATIAVSYRSCRTSIGFFEFHLWVAHQVWSTTDGFTPTMGKNLGLHGPPLERRWTRLFVRRITQIVMGIYRGSNSDLGCKPFQEKDKYGRIFHINRYSRKISENVENLPNFSKESLHHPSTTRDGGVRVGPNFFGRPKVYYRKMAPIG